MVFPKWPSAQHWWMFPPPTTRLGLMPRIPFQIHNQKLKIKGGLVWKRATHTRLEQIGYTLTQLFKDERIETSYFRAYEVRMYAERLIVEAMRNGDKHRPTMAAANALIHEKQLIHKLFHVFVPRYLNHVDAFTNMWLVPFDQSKIITQAGSKYNSVDTHKAVIEMKGNPWPPIHKPKIDTSDFLTNVLLNAAKNEKS